MPSSVVARYEYHPVSLTLRITYVSGIVYDYLKVPEEVYNAFKASGSKGTYLNKNIKGHFGFKKIT